MIMTTEQATAPTHDHGPCFGAGNRTEYGCPHRNRDGCGSSGGSEVLRFRSSGVAGVLVHDGAGVTAHRWLKVAFIPSNLVKATFSHHRTTSEDTTVTPTTSAPPRTSLALADLPAPSSTGQ